MAYVPVGIDEDSKFPPEVEDRLMALITTPVEELNDPAVANLIEDSGSATNASLSATFVSAVMPEAFGAVGDGVADDTAAVQAAIDSLPAAGGQVLLAQRYKINTVTVTEPDIRITGPGVIVDGTIAIGQDGTAPPYARLDTRIDTIAFYRAGTSTTVNAITAARCMGIKIDDVDFTGYNAAFYVRPQSFTGTSTHHVARVRMSRIKTTDCQFVLRTTKYTSGGGLLACADIKISDSHELAVLDSHVFCEGVDGLRLTDVTLFMPGFNTSSATKRWNVRVDGGTHVELTAVHCFEAGLEGIYLSKIQSFGFSDVEVWAPGQRVRSAGVRVNGGDTAAAQYCFGDLDGTRVVFPSLHGVWIEGPSGHIKVPHVTVRSPGASSYYYGPTDTTPAEYVLAESATQYVNVGAASEFTTGSGSPRIVVRGAKSNGRSGAVHSVFLPASMTPAGSVNFSTNSFASTYPFGVRTISSASQDDNMTHYADLSPGTYSFDLWHDKGADRGIYSVRIDGVEVGTIDGYAASPATAKDTLTGIVVPVGGRLSIVLFMATKNAASTAYRGAIHALAMTRTAGF